MDHCCYPCLLPLGLVFPCLKAFFGLGFVLACLLVFLALFGSLFLCFAVVFFPVPFMCCLSFVVVHPVRLCFAPCLYFPDQFGVRLVIKFLSGVVLVIVLFPSILVYTKMRSLGLRFFRYT